MIHDHRYDAGWPRDDSKGCIDQPQGEVPCGESEHVHMLSEYPSQRPARDEGVEHRQTSNEPECPGIPHRGHTTRDVCPLERQAGDMHEPAAYPFHKLDWDDPDLASHLHPFVD